MQERELIHTSERLSFRLFEDGDFDDLKKLDMDPEVRAYFPGGVATLEQVRERISTNLACFAENGFSDFAVIESETGRFVGRAGFGLIERGEIEVGYVFLKEYWGQAISGTDTAVRSAILATNTPATDSTTNASGRTHSRSSRRFNKNPSRPLKFTRSSISLHAVDKRGSTALAAWPPALRSLRLRLACELPNLRGPSQSGIVDA